MIKLVERRIVIDNGRRMPAEAAEAQGLNLQAAARNSLSMRILDAHDRSNGQDGQLRIAFDALASHDITYVGIIQTARASGLEAFPLPYVLTNCHNSLCAVGGTINEDDHVFGLAAAKKYGGIFVPPHLAVIHQYIRETTAACGGMVLGSDSHTRYGALGCLGVGEGGPELVKQLLGQTWDIARPEVVAVWLSGRPRPGVGPQDVALALIGAVFANAFVKNRVLEFMGPGVAELSVDFRLGVDVMSTETTCLSSVWTTDQKVRDYLAAHGRAADFSELVPRGPALYDRMLEVDLSAIEPMIALPFHPSNVFAISDLLARPREILAEVDRKAAESYGPGRLNLSGKIGADGSIMTDQGIIAGCAGGSFENISLASSILAQGHAGSGNFGLSVYPASVPVAVALIGNGSTERLYRGGALVKTAFCGPCFGAGDTPANGALSIRHSTRNFPFREGSKPGEGQLACVALMDARSIAATAANGGRLTPASALDWSNPALAPDLSYHYDPSFYRQRVYNGYGCPNGRCELVFGPNIADWPKMPPLPEHLVLRLASVICDPVTTTDELIPSGETSSLRSNPLRLAEHTLSRKDPGYVERAKAMRRLEEDREKNPRDPELLARVREICEACAGVSPVAAMLGGPEPLARIGLGSVIFAVRPGDGSAREQAASSQRVLGGWANIAVEYATKRYRSNLINWGMLPLLGDIDLTRALAVGDYIVLPNVRQALISGSPNLLAGLLHVARDGSGQWAEQIAFSLTDLTREERQIILAGCLINFNSKAEDKN